MNLTEKTTKYIKEHPNIKHCLRDGLINYSSLARKIIKDLHLDEDTSKEAITIAARRYYESLGSEKDNEENIQKIMSGYETEIKSKICIFIIDKRTSIDDIENIQRNIREDNGTIYFLEGTEFYKLITEEKHKDKIISLAEEHIIKLTKDTVLIKLKSEKDNDYELGIISYISGLFAENNIPIIDFISCWTDTYIIINSQYLKKAIFFLNI